MDLHAGAVPGDEAVPDGRLERWVKVTLMRGRRRVLFEIWLWCTIFTAMWGILRKYEGVALHAK